MGIPVIRSALICKGSNRATASPGCGANCEGARVAVTPARVKSDSSYWTTPRLLSKALNMTANTLPPENCTTMAEVRAGVDQTDQELVALLVRRFGYMDAAARIKPSRDLVRDESRKAQVVDNARSLADAHGLPADAIAALWDLLVETSIAYEMAAFERCHTVNGDNN